MSKSNIASFMSFIWQGLWLCIPLYPYFSNSTKQVYDRNVFEQMRIHGISWDEGLEMLEEVHNLRNSFLESNLGNSEVYLVRGNQRFAFLAYHNHSYKDGKDKELKSGSFGLWDDNSRKVGEYHIDDFSSAPSAEFVKWIDEITKLYCDGTIRCSNCGKPIRMEEIAGRFFAGVYCSECWEGGIKQQAARETYD